MLYIEIKDPITENCFPLIPEDDNLKSFKFYIYSSGNRQHVEFVVQSEKKIDLHIGSSYYHKLMTND